jgi:hypothetical protein
VISKGVLQEQKQVVSKVGESERGNFKNWRCAQWENWTFREFCGANQASISATFLDLQTTLIQEACIKKPNLDCLLMTMHWFAKCPTEGLPAGKLGGLDASTVRDNI